MSSSLSAGTADNYQPISKLPFISKILEKIVSNQILAIIEQNHIFKKFQSGFCKHHSTETALLKVTNDLLMNADAGLCSVFVLLNLSSAFDTVNHAILLHRLQHWVGISGTVLSWFKSYLSNRKSCVSVNNYSSSFADIKYGVPQRSILGPILFSLYLLPLGNVICRHGISFHCYADDTQLYLPIKATDPSMLRSLHNCLNDVKNWMANNFLQLNYNKTEILIVGPQHFHEQLMPPMGHLLHLIKPVTRNLGVLFDNKLCYE